MDRFLGGVCSLSRQQELPAGEPSPREGGARLAGPVRHPLGRHPPSRAPVPTSRSSRHPPRGAFLTWLPDVVQVSDEVAVVGVFTVILDLGEKHGAVHRVQKGPPSGNPAVWCPCRLGRAWGAGRRQPVRAPVVRGEKTWLFFATNCPGPLVSSRGTGLKRFGSSQGESSLSSDR